MICYIMHYIASIYSEYLCFSTMAVSILHLALLVWQFYHSSQPECTRLTDRKHEKWIRLKLFILWVLIINHRLPKVSLQPSSKKGCEVGGGVGGRGGGGVSPLSHQDMRYCYILQSHLLLIRLIHVSITVRINYDNTCHDILRFSLVYINIRWDDEIRLLLLDPLPVGVN